MTQRVNKWFFALALLPAAIIVACAQAPEAAELGEASEALSSCGEVRLTATRSHEDERSFSPARTFVLPTTLTAEARSCGVQAVEAELKAEGPGGGRLKCTYRRSGAGPLRLASCNTGLLAGQTFSAREVELEVERGPRGAEVEAVLVQVAPCPDAGTRDAQPDSQPDAEAGIRDAQPDSDARDGAVEAGRDGGDAGRDASTDAGPDATPDAGPTGCTATSCDDGNACNGVETCNTGTGACVPGTPPVVDDGNPCTVDGCLAASGVTHLPAPTGTVCSDGNACNGPEACNGTGVCVGGPPLLLDDGNPCTADACDPSGGVTHNPTPAGSSCTDGNACNGAEVCNGAGGCTSGAVPTVDDGNPCTIDSCDAALGVVHAPAAAGTLCTDNNVCNGAEACNGAGVCGAGTPLAVDDGNACTRDACDPIVGVSHVPDFALPGCDVPPPLADEDAFEPHASILGRVVDQTGAPLTGAVVEAFDAPATGAPRADLTVSQASDGSFRARLMNVPSSVPDGTPPVHVIVKLSKPGTITAQRDVVLHPTEVLDIGSVSLVARDPKVTVIGPAGGTATDTSGDVEVVIPAGALAADIPVQITPFRKREDFPTPLPDQTLTAYGFELEPDGQAFASPVTVRVRNTKALPTTLRIPVGSVDPTTASWRHEGLALWDGTKWATQITHFSRWDLNPSRADRLVLFFTDGGDSQSSLTCPVSAGAPEAGQPDANNVGSSAGLASGILKVAMPLPSFSRRNETFAPRLVYASNLAGTFAPRTPGATPGASTGATPSSGIRVGGRSVLARATCIEGAAADALASSDPTACVTSTPCSAKGGRFVLPTSFLSNGFGLTEQQTQPGDPQAADFVIDGSFDLPGTPGDAPYAPAFVTQRIAIQVAGATSCAGSGGPFGARASVDAPTTVPLPPSPIATIERSVFVPHRLSSPFGTGWSFDGWARTFVDPRGSQIVRMDAAGTPEAFIPRVFTRRFGVEGGVPVQAVTVAETGEVFTYQQGLGKILQHTDEAAAVDVLSGVATTGQVFEMATTMVGAERHFLLATQDALYDASSTGTRVLATRSGSSGFRRDGLYAPSITARGAQVVFTKGNATDTTLFTLNLTDATPVPVPLGATAGDIGLDPRAVLGAFQFLHPRGVGFAPNGLLYVADRRRNVVYRVSPNASGVIDADSPIERAFGDGAGAMQPPPGLRFLGSAFPLNQPLSVRVSPDGVVFTTTPTGLSMLDPRTGEAEVRLYDGGAASSELLDAIFIQGQPFAPANRTSFYRAAGWYFREDVRYSSEYQPTRTVEIEPSGGLTLLDTEANEIERYDARGRLVERRTRENDPIVSFEYASPTSGRVTRMVTAIGDATEFAYTDGRVSTITDPAGRSTLLAYDARGDLARLRLPNGDEHLFTYAEHKLTRRQSPRGDVTTYTFASDGTLRGTKKPAGETFSVEPAYVRAPGRDAAGNTVREGVYTDSHGVTHTFQVNTLGQIVSDVSAPDGIPYARSTVFDDVLTEPRPSLFGGMIPQDGIARANTVGAVRYRTTNGMPVGQVFDTDPLGRTAVVYASATGPTDVATLYRPDGRVESISTGGNNIFVNRYNAEGRLVQVDEAPNLGAPIRVEATYTYRPDGLVDTATDRGFGTSFTYDSRGLLSGATDALGRSVALSRDAAGHVVTTSDGQASASQAFDLNGRLTQSLDGTGNATTYRYDATDCGCSQEDRVTAIHTPDLPAGKSWTFGYGPEGRLIRITDPDGRDTSLGYKPTGELAQAIDALGRTHTMAYDAQGRFTGALDALGRAQAHTQPTPQSGGHAGTSFLASRPSGAPSTDATAALADGEYQIGVGSFSNVEMLSRGRPRTTFYRDATLQVVYAQAWGNAHGQFSRRIDLQGASPLVNGDLGSLPGTKGQLSDYASAVDINWGLYPTSNETTRPSGFSDATFAYNARREVIEATGGFAGFGPRYAYTRDIGGRVTFLERRDVFSPDPLFNTSYAYTPQGYPGGFTNGEGAHSFTYDARGLLATMVAPEGTYSYEHDAAGRNRLLVFPDGHQREQAFDAQGRITSRCYRYPGQPAFDRCYTSEYDATGNPVRMVDPEGEDLLTVDALDRLTSVTRRVAGQADVVETLSYNALGALGSHAGSTLNTARPRLTGGGTAPSAIPASIDGRDVSIDGLGQVVGIGSETLSWTRSGQLTGIVRAADEERYSYDAYQRRIARSRGPVGGPFASVYYTYEGPNIAQEVTMSPNALLRSWIYDGVDHPLRMRDSRPGAATPIAYYELDLAGNVRRLRAPGGADLGGYRYAAFGKQLAADATTPAPTVDQPMRWKGRWWSEFGGAAGTYDMRARIWAPELGVFLSIDEFAYHEASSTLWGWPGMNPAKYSDPSGRFAIALPFFGVAAGGGTSAGVGAVVGAIAAPIVAGLILTAETYYLMKNVPAAVRDVYTYVNPTIEQGKNFAVSEGDDDDGGTTDDDDNVVDIPYGDGHPEAGDHAGDVADVVEGVIDRPGAAGRRKKNMKGKKCEKGKDRDEYPPAVIKTDTPTSVRNINPHDNRGAGSKLRHRINGLPNGTRVRLHARRSRP